MKKIKDKSIIFITIIFLISCIYGIGLIKHKIWRAEHPDAEAWTFFIPSKR